MPCTEEVRVMSEHFVKYIRIKQYKCFNNFSAEGFKRVNLISGKNNIGKTALMETCFISVASDSVKTFVRSLDLINYLRTNLDNNGEKANSKKRSEQLTKLAGLLKISTNVSSVSFNYDDSDVVRSYKFAVNENVHAVSESSMDVEAIIQNTPKFKNKRLYIPSTGLAQNEIIRSFAAIQKKDREADVNRILMQFDSSIENVKIIGGDSIQCKVSGGGESFFYHSIDEFGDGLRHYLSIVADLFNAENGYVFIDELDNGIHYTSLDQLWEIILSLSKELNVQVFATTHSKECIESYCRAAEKLKDEDISFITLVKNKEKAVKAIVRDYEVFTDSIHDEREVRGW